MDVAKSVLPIHDDIHSVEVHIRVHVYETILGARIIYDHRSILVVPIYG